MSNRQNAFAVFLLYFRDHKSRCVTEDRSINSWDRLPACRFEIDRLEAYPTLRTEYRFAIQTTHSIATSVLPSSNFPDLIFVKFSKV